MFVSDFFDVNSHRMRIHVFGRNWNNFYDLGNFSKFMFSEIKYPEISVNQLPKMILQNSEIDLWLKVCRGDIDAFGILFKKHYKSLFISALLLVKDEKVAEDVVQDVFLKIWNKRGELELVANFSSYLYISVKNACLDQLRKIKYNDDVSEVEISDTSLDPFHSVRIKELSKHLQEATDSLPAQCKIIFEMVYVDGKKYQEVADELGVSINTVKTQVKRALEKMRIIMKNFR